MEIRHEIVSTEKHLKDISGLAKPYLIENMGGAGNESMEKFMAGIRNTLRSNSQHVVIQYSGEEPTGFALVNAPPRSPTGNLDYIFIMPDRRGEGLGNAFAGGLEKLFGKRYWDGLLLTEQSKRIMETLNGNK